MARRTSRRRRRGRRIRGLILRYGEIPPAGGAERTDYVLYQGHLANQRAGLLLDRSTAAVEAATGAPVPVWLASTPPAGHSADDARKDLLTASELVVSLALAWSPNLTTLPGLRPLPGEVDARNALRRAKETYHWLAETEHAEMGHRNLHAIGRYVSVLYGCYHLWDDDDQSWYEVCPSRLAHIPYGQSPGFTTGYICSVCGDDPSECEHHPDDTVDMVASRVTGRCSICDAENRCEHEPGTTHPVRPRAIWTDPVMHETSLVPRPRDPLARISEVEIRDAPKEPSTPTRRWRCLQCAMGCDTLTPY